MSFLDGMERKAPDPGLPAFNPRSLRISPEGVKYKRKEMKAKYIVGIRFYSDLEEKTVERPAILGRRIWTFKYSKGTLEFLNINRKRLCIEIYARNEQQHQQFVDAVNSALRYIVPTLLKNLATKIHADNEFKIGKLQLNKTHVQLTTGWIFRKHHSVPYRDIEIDHEDGQIDFAANGAPKVRASLDVRSTWNAVILQ